MLHVFIVRVYNLRLRFGFKIQKITKTAQYNPKGMYNDV
jgi:hypothetical protein